VSRCFAIALVLGCLPACDTPTATEAAVGTVEALPLRLVDVAGEHHLVQAPALPPTEVLFREAFDTTDVFDHWHPESSKRTMQRSLGWRHEAEAGRVCLDRTADAPVTELRVSPDLRRDLAVDGDDALSLTLRLKTEGVGSGRTRGGGAGFILDELDAHGTRLIRHTDLPRVFGDQDEAEVHASLQTHADTRTLRVLLQAAESLVIGQVCFTELTIERHTPRQLMTSGVDANPGLRANPHPLVQSIEASRDSRPALVSPGPATWGVTFEAGPAARLRTSVARLGTVKGEACGTVRLDGEELGRTCLAHRGWEELELELPASDAPRALQLEATADPELGLAWGDPTIQALGTPTQAGPDLAIIVIDTLRADHLGSGGYTARSTSPELDAFAATATRYSAAQAPSGWTAPSLGSVMTGLWPSRHRAGQRRVRAWNPLTKKGSDTRATDYLTLSPSVLTLAERLRAVGYDTTGFVTNNFFGPRVRFDRGFGRYQLVRANDVIGGARVVEAVDTWLAGQEGALAPSLLVIHFIEPHHPYRRRAHLEEGLPEPTELDLEEEEKRGMRARTLRDLDPVARANPEQTKTMYDAEIRYVDAILGPLLQRLDDGERTIVVLSDHGEAFGEHGAFVHGNTLYQELVHVPLWVRQPGQEGAVVDTPVSLVDVTPTLLQIAGLPPDETLDGQALPTAERPSEDTGRVIVAEAMYKGPDRVQVRQGPWTYIRQLPSAEKISRARPLNTSRTGRKASERLYDLRVDPTQQTDLADSDSPPTQLAALRELALEHLARHTPGLHLRCTEPGELSVEVDAVVGQIDLPDTDRGDAFAIGRTRHTVMAELGESAPHHFVLRTLSPVSTVAVSQGEDTLWTGSPTGYDQPVEAGPCTLWQVGGSAQSLGELNADDQAELRALGYLE